MLAKLYCRSLWVPLQFSWLSNSDVAESKKHMYFQLLQFLNFVVFICCRKTSSLFGKIKPTNKWAHTLHHHYIITSSLHNHYIITHHYTSSYISSHHQYITITSSLHNHYIITHHHYIPLHNHYITITLFYVAITSPLHCHYIAITSPLYCHYIAITLPLHRYYITITSPWCNVHLWPLMIHLPTHVCYGELTLCSHLWLPLQGGKWVLTVKEDAYGEVLDKTWMELVSHSISELLVQFD